MALMALIHTCESHESSAPRFTIPCLTSMTMPKPPQPDAYPIATCCSVVVDMKAASTPPATPTRPADKEWFFRLLAGDGDGPAPFGSPPAWPSLD